MNSTQHKNILEFNGILALFFLILFFITNRDIFIYVTFLSLVMGLFLRPVMVPVYTVWMKIASILGRINNRIILFVIFYAVLTPLAVIRRMKSDDLLLTKKQKLSTYWIEKKETYSKEYFERQF